MKNFIKSTKSNVIKPSVLFLASMLLSVIDAFAQDVNNIKSNLSSIQEKQRQLEHEELMNNIVYPAIGFCVVVAIAWYSNSWVKKRRLAEDVAKAHRAAAAHHHHHPHDPYKRHAHQVHKVKR